MLTSHLRVALHWADLVGWAAAYPGLVKGALPPALFLGPRELQEQREQRLVQVQAPGVVLTLELEPEFVALVLKADQPSYDYLARWACLFDPQWAHLL